MRIAGRQIVLRDWQQDDVPVWWHWTTPGHAWQQLDGPYFPAPTADELVGLRERLERAVQAANWPDPRTNLPICLCTSDRLIGRVNWYWRERETGWRALGIDVYDPAYWRRGIGYEALGLWTDYLLGALPDVHRLDLSTWSGNAAMMRLARRLGFREEARFRKARLVGGNLYDSVAFGVLREEWASRYPRGFSSHLREPAGPTGRGAR